MKRYRVFSFDYDSRATALRPVNDNWDEDVKKQHEKNRKAILEHLIGQFGEFHSEQKSQNFIDLGLKPFSILAYHNRFLEQSRNAFVIGAYYPALTAACALGERILNHLMLILRDYFKSTDEYKKVYRKSSFDDWESAISTLEAWGVLLLGVAKDFRKLKKMRNNSIHFRHNIEINDRQLALEAIQKIQKIIGNQFSGIGPQP